ncbi:MAG: acetoin utilization protein AcuC [Deltaproteobacteria bacterium]|nr:acetoin utilization protein AcuC [Deltaproteobacteria bacterium]
MAKIIYSEKFERYTYGVNHPFRLDRGRLFLNSAARLSILNSSDVIVVDEGNEGDLKLFHTDKYIEILKKANDGEIEAEFLQYGLGLPDNPVFKGVFDLVLLHAAMARKAFMELQNSDRIFVPVGGLHHAMRNRASGFCYINDLGILIELLLRENKRVFYIDIDAHHGDGIQSGFYDNPMVLKMSFHESGKTLFPFSGFEDEIGIESGRFFNLNVPLNCYSDDEVFLFLFKKIFVPIIERFDPDVTVAQIGVDMMSTDPLTHLRLTNNSYIEAVKIIKDKSKRLIAFGGGGYNPDNIARGYTLAWAVLNDIEVDDYYTATLGGTFMGSQELSIGSLKDMNLFVSGPEKEVAMEEAVRIYNYYRENIFPFFKLE